MSRKNKKGNFFNENYGKSWTYLKNSKMFIFAGIVFFFFFVLIGILIPAPEIIRQKIFELIEELLRKTEGMSQWQLIKFLFLNNVQSAFFGMILGFGFGIFSMVSIVVNGYLIGFVALKSVEIGGIFVLWKLFPHGIFELPALFISVGLGLKLGSFMFRKDINQTLGTYFKESIRAFVFIVIPLLIIAAIIEGSLIFIFRGL